VLTNFDNIVFDLGGVVIDLDRRQCIDSFESLGFKDADSDLGQYVQAGLFFQLETGKISAADFFDGVKAKCRPGTTNSDIERAFNAFLIALPVERLKTLRALRQHARVFALSNTNPVMFNSWIAEAFSQEGLKINDYFDGIIASFAEGVCKPDPEIFRTLIARYSLEPERTLFLDDSEANCEAARSCGLKAERIDSDNTMIKFVSGLMRE